MDFERQSSPLRGERKEHGKTAAFVSLIKAQPVPGRYDLAGRVGRLLGALDQLLIDWLSDRRTEIKWGGGGGSNTHWSLPSMELVTRMHTLRASPIPKHSNISKKR